jgi:tetratricopeptide (TPR) repeat protein
MRRTHLIQVGLTLLVLGLFCRAGQFPFIALDDSLYVTANPHVLGGVRWSSFRWAFTATNPYWHPLTWISHILDAELFGNRAGGPHLVNVLFHAANTLVLFVVLRQLTQRRWCSAVVALLFAIHPLRVESVAWVTERKDVLSAFFFLLGIGAYRRYVERPGGLRYFAVVVCLLLGLLAKPMLVTFPFVLLLLDFWPLSRMNRKTFLGVVLEKGPLFILSAAFSVVTFYDQRSLNAVMPLSYQGVWPRVAHALVSYERYLGKIFWPYDLVLPYPFVDRVEPLELGWALVLLAAVTVLAMIMRHRWPYVMMGWLWFVGTLIPVIGIVQAGAQGMADRFTYIPSIGILIALTWLGASLARAWRVPAYATSLAVIGAAIVLAWLTSWQMSYWKSGDRLFRHSLAVNPNEVVSLFSLASEYATQNRMSEAIPCLESLLHETPNDGAVYFHLGQALEVTGDKRRAAEEYELAITMHSSEGVATMAGALNNLSWIRATSAEPNLRDGEEALRLARRSGDLIGAGDANQLDTLAAACAEQGDFESAVSNATRAAEIAEADGSKELSRQIRQRLEMYARQQPFRESSR